MERREAIVAVLDELIAARLHQRAEQRHRVGRAAYVQLSSVEAEESAGPCPTALRVGEHLDLVEDANGERLVQTAHLDRARCVLGAFHQTRLLPGAQRARYAIAAQPIVHLPSEQAQWAAVDARRRFSQRLQRCVRLAAVGWANVRVNRAARRPCDREEVVRQPQIGGLLECSSSLPSSLQWWQMQAVERHRRRAKLPPDDQQRPHGGQAPAPAHADDVVGPFHVGRARTERNVHASAHKRPLREPMDACKPDSARAALHTFSKRLQALHQRHAAVPLAFAGLHPVPAATQCETTTTHTGLAVNATLLVAAPLVLLLLLMLRRQRHRVTSSPKAASSPADTPLTLTFRGEEYTVVTRGSPNRLAPTNLLRRFEAASDATSANSTTLDEKTYHRNPSTVFKTEPSPERASHESAPAQPEPTPPRTPSASADAQPPPPLLRKHSSRSNRDEWQKQFARKKLDSREILQGLYAGVGAEPLTRPRPRLLT